MSEKRLASSGDSFVDLTQMETVDLLNKLSDENTRLHKKVDEQQATISRLEENIERIKIKLLKMEKVIDRMLSKEEQIGFYNLVELEFYNMMELEMIRDE